MVDIDENGNIKIKLNSIDNFTELETIRWSDNDKLTFVSEYKYNKLKNKLEKIKELAETIYDTQGNACKYHYSLVKILQIIESEK